MDKATTKKVNDFLSQIAEEYNEYRTAFLFGSYAKGAEKEESDIDIAIVFDQLTDDQKFDLQVELMIKASAFDTRIEPHPISKADTKTVTPFSIEIQKTGIEIGPAAAKA